MKEGVEPLPLTFQYLILMLWRPCDLNLVMISSLASNGSQDFNFSLIFLFSFIFFKYETIETHARAFLTLIILAIARVYMLILVRKLIRSTWIGRAFQQRAQRSKVLLACIIESVSRRVPVWTTSLPWSQENDQRRQFKKCIEARYFQVSLIYYVVPQRP